MRSRLHFMGNGYAGELLDIIRNGRSVHTVMNAYDFMVLKSQLGNLDGVTANGNQLTIFDGRGSFVTNISSTNELPNGNIQFIDRYSSQIYLLFDGLQDSGYLVTENNELLLV